RAERHDGDREEPRKDGERRRHAIDPPVGVRRVDRLLEEELDPVGEREEDPAGTGAHRSGPCLEVGDHLPLHPDHEQDRDEEHGEHDHDLAEQHAPIDPGHADPPATAAGSASSPDAPGRSDASTASSSTATVNAPASSVLAAKPGWLNGTNTVPSAM